jgi:hypothetical protein
MAQRGRRARHEQDQRKGAQGEARACQGEGVDLGQAELDDGEVGAPDRGDEDAEQEVFDGHDRSFVVEAGPHSTNPQPSRSNHFFPDRLRIAEGCGRPEKCRQAV